MRRRAAFLHRWIARIPKLRSIDSPANEPNMSSTPRNERIARAVAIRYLAVAIPVPTGREDILIFLAVPRRESGALIQRERRPYRMLARALPDARHPDMLCRQDVREILQRGGVASRAHPQPVEHTLVRPGHVLEQAVQMRVHGAARGSSPASA